MNTGPEQSARGKWWARGILPALGLLALAIGLLIAWQTNIRLRKQLEEVESEREYLEQQKLSDALNISEQEGRATTGPGEMATADAPAATPASVPVVDTMPATPRADEIPDLVREPGAKPAEITGLAPEPVATSVVAETGTAATAAPVLPEPAAQATTPASATAADPTPGPAAWISLPEKFQQMFANDDGVGMRWDFTRKFWHSMRDFPDEATAAASAAKWNAAIPKSPHVIAARAAGYTYVPQGKRVLLIRPDSPAPETTPPPQIGDVDADTTKPSRQNVAPEPLATTPAKPGPRPARVPSPVEWTAVPDIVDSRVPRARQVAAAGDTQIVPGSTPIPLPASAKHNFVITYLNIGLQMRWDERSQAWYSADPRQVNGQSAALVASMNAARGTCYEDKAALAAGYVYQSFSPSQLILGPPDLQPSDTPPGLATATATPVPGIVPAPLPVVAKLPRSFTNSNKLKMEREGLLGFYIHDPKGKKKGIFLPAHADTLNRAPMIKDEKALFDQGFRYQAVDGKLFFGPVE